MQHGGDLTDAMAGWGAGDPPWLDLSTGINPHPWPVPAELRCEGWEALPSRAALDRLLAAAREAYGVSDGAAIVAAPGTQAVIQWLPRLAPPGPVAVVGPTYGEHAASWRAAGFAVREVATLPAARGARHVVVVNPNNPDGRLLAPDTLRTAATACAQEGGWLVVDESFVDLSPDRSVAALAAGLPVVVLRSFGKFHGLAGLRLGFAVAPVPIAREIAAALGPWAVSGPALTVGAAALADRAWTDAMRRRLAREAASLDAVLTGAGLALAGGTALFRLVRHPEAAALHARLAAAHIWCRRFPDEPDLLRFGLPPGLDALKRLRIALAAHAQGSGTSRSIAR